MNFFGSNHSEVGLLDLNLILNTAGKIKIRYGHKFIDLLDNEGNINAPIPKIVTLVDSKDSIKSNGFYLLDDILYLKYQDLLIEVSNQKVGYLEYTNPQQLTEEQIKTVQNNIGLSFNSTSDVSITNGIIFIGNEIYKVDGGKFSEYIKDPLKSINNLEKNPSLNNSAILWDNKKSWVYVPVVTLEEFNNFKTNTASTFLKLLKSNEEPILSFDLILYSGKVFTISSFKPILHPEVVPFKPNYQQNDFEYISSSAEIKVTPTIDVQSGALLVSSISGRKAYYNGHIEITDEIVTHLFNLQYAGGDNFNFVDRYGSPTSYTIFRDHDNNGNVIFAVLIPKDDEINESLHEQQRYMLFYQNEEILLNNHLYVKLDPDEDKKEKFRLDYLDSQMAIEENEIKGGKIEITPHVVFGDLDDTKKFYSKIPVPFRTYREREKLKYGLFSTQSVFNGAEFRLRWDKENKEIIPEIYDYPRYSKYLSNKLEEQLKPTNIDDDNKLVIPDINWILKYVLIPVGVILMWSGSPNDIPDGWAICNGQTVEGITTPNLTNRFIVGVGSNYDLGDTGGENYHTLTESEMPRHSHKWFGDDELASYSSNWENSNMSNAGDYDAASGDSGGEYLSKIYYTGYAGSGESHENRPPYYALYYIMKIK